ncbi:MAG: hypothetical protein R3B90_12395 [Planctomycetaceae bacterium]
MLLNANQQITSSGGEITVTGTGTPNSAAACQRVVSIASAGNAEIAIIADSLDITAVSGTIVDSGSGTTTIVQPHRRAGD